MTKGQVYNTGSGFQNKSKKFWSPYNTKEPDDDEDEILWDSLSFIF